MRNLRKAFVTTAKRGLKGMVVGAGMGCVIAVAGAVSLFGPFVLTDYDPSTVERLRIALRLAVLAGVFVGGIAGLAARLPRNGMGLLASIAVVGGCAGLGVLLDALGWVPERLPLSTYLSVILPASLGGAVVFVYGATDKPQWFFVGLRCVRSVVRWVTIVAAATALVWVCYKTIGEMKWSSFLILLILSLVVCMIVSTYVAFVCKSAGVTVVLPFITAIVGLFCMFAVQKVGPPLGVVVGFLIGLMVVLLPFGKPSQPKKPDNADPKVKPNP